MNKIDEYLDSLPDWQKANLELFRTLLHEVEPNSIEDWKWNVPVFLVGGKIYFAMSAFKAHTKFNFMANGALINDPDVLFNNGFDSKKSRGIDLREGEVVNESKLKKLIEISISYG